jgi:putative tricarboxylic transport membrane protein
VKKVDRTALPFIAVGLLILVNSRELHFGRFNSPGPALFPVLLGIILILLSMTSFFISNEEKIPKGGFITRKVLCVIGILIGYWISLPFFGFFFTTLLMLIILLKFVGRQKWLSTITWSLLTTIASFLLFIRWFGVPFPKGILPF